MAWFISRFRTRVNEDIVTGGWRRLNLQKPPFSFPPYKQAVWDGPRPDGTSKDKMLGLYEFADLPVDYQAVHLQG